MARRSSNPPHPPPRNDAGAQPSWAPDSHSGEGAASALALLQALEKRRGVDRPADPPVPEGADTDRPNA